MNVKAICRAVVEVQTESIIGVPNLWMKSVEANNAVHATLKPPANIGRYYRFVPPNARKQTKEIRSLSKEWFRVGGMTPRHICSRSIHPQIGTCRYAGE